MNTGIQFVINMLVIILGPAIAVIITLAYQKYKAKKDIKHRAFLVLMAHRKSIPPTRAMVEVLNTLDVVFANNRTIVDLWHKYYILLGQAPSEERVHTWLELLGAIAADLNYPTVKQTDLDKFYIPQGHVDQIELQLKIQNEMLRVLENTSSLVVNKKENLKT